MQKVIIGIGAYGLAGVILVDEEKARQKEQQERQRNERSNNNTRDGNAPHSSQSNTGKDEKGLKKKNTETNLIFGF